MKGGGVYELLEIFYYTRYSTILRLVEIFFIFILQKIAMDTIFVHMYN